MATFTGTQTRTNASTSIDRIAQLINLHRLPGESLRDFKARVLDNYIHPANASYRGLYNGVSRELGVANYTGGIIIDVERTDGIPTVDPSIICSVDDNGILATRDTTLSTRFPANWDRFPEDRWKPNPSGFDYIARFNRTGSYFLVDLLSALNRTAGLEAVMWGTAKNFDKSHYLRKQTSLQYIANRPVNGTNLQTFYEDINESNWLLSAVWGPNTGITESVDTLDELVDCEQYCIPQFSRSIHTFSPPMTGSVSVYWNQFPMIIPLSPVVIRTFADYDHLSINSERHLDAFGDELLGIPTVQGADAINEALSVTPMYWGE